MPLLPPSSPVHVPLFSSWATVFLYDLKPREHVWKPISPRLAPDGSHREKQCNLLNKQTNK